MAIVRHDHEQICPVRMAPNPQELYRRVHALNSLKNEGFAGESRGAVP